MDHGVCVCVCVFLDGLMVRASYSWSKLRFLSVNEAGLFTADVMFIYIFMPNDIKRTWSNA